MKFQKKKTFEGILEKKNWETARTAGNQKELLEKFEEIMQEKFPQEILLQESRKEDLGGSQKQLLNEFEQDVLGKTENDFLSEFPLLVEFLKESHKAELKIADRVHKN